MADYANSTIGVQPAPDLSQPLLVLFSQGLVSHNAVIDGTNNRPILQEDVSATLSDTTPDNQVPAVVNYVG